MEAVWSSTVHELLLLQVVIRRDRLCIPVRAGRQGELPKGSLTLATSASGALLAWAGTHAGDADQPPKHQL